VNPAAGVFPAAWQQALWGVWIITLLPFIAKRAWAPLRQPTRLNLWCAAITVIFTLWCIRYSVKPGLMLHLLGATILMLMFGPRLAQLALYLVMAGVAVTGIAAFDGYPANALLAGAVPVWVSWLLLQLIERRLPTNIFVFIFITGFLSAALAMAVSAAATVVLHAAAGTYAVAYLTEYYLPYALLLGWGEAFITGMSMALMVAYYPQWVLLFDDKRYLARR
jgi:uncharacterized membrane protein